MSIYKKLHVKSGIKDYGVYFTDNFNDGFESQRGKNLYLIIDKNVSEYYKSELAPILKIWPYMILEATEKQKTLDRVKVVIRKLIDDGFKRNHTLVAIGGGIIQDIVGFAASILYRGVDWAFYPTTLLAQSDSCIGSKTSINIDQYKNQLGNFYPPRAVFLNTAFLGTLSDKDIRSGLGEIIKVHFLDGRRSLDYINANYDASLRDKRVMDKLIFRSLNIKKRVIEIDEFDTGYRNIMNYGHTFGHALESLTNYGLCHGQAITVGMDISNYISYRLKYISKSSYFMFKEVLLKDWPRYYLNNLDMGMYFKSLSKDKKNIDNRINMILTKGPGRMMKKGFVMNKKMRGIILSYFAGIKKEHDAR